MGRFDTVVLGGRVVLPGRGQIPADIGIKDGRISAVGEGSHRATPTKPSTPEESWCYLARSTPTFTWGSTATSPRIRRARRSRRSPAV